MAKPTLLASSGRLIVIADNAWKADILPKVREKAAK